MPSFWRRKRPELETPSRKLVVVGDGGCGKTSLLYAFTHGAFIGTYTPTVFETAVVDVKLKESQTLQLSLWDTAGQEDFSQLRPLCYPGTDVVLLCFAMDSRDSFDNLLHIWIPEVSHHCPDAALTLVGCKCDLNSCVTEDEMDKLVDKIGAVGHFVCSAKLMHGVQDLFNSTASVAYQAGRRRKKRRRGSAAIVTSCLGGKGRTTLS